MDIILRLFILSCSWLLILTAKAQDPDTLSCKRLEGRLDKYLQAACDNYRFNGTALVAQRGLILLNKGYGWKNFRNQNPNDSGSIFQIGSITKPFTSLIILKLQEQGMLSVSDPLNKYFPNYPNGDRITLQNLLTHTSGIYNYTRDIHPYHFILRKTMTKERILRIFRNKPLEFTPGTRFSYSNSGYFLLGMIVEKVTGKPYEQVVRENIFDPLHMKHSGFDFRNLRDPSKTTGYSLFGSNRKVESTTIDSTVLYSAGGIYSNTGDLYRWLKAVSAGQLLSAASWQQSHTPFLNNYGYGWIVDTLYGKVYKTHSGFMMDYMTSIMYYPKEEVTIILLNNFSAREDLWPLCIELSQIIFHQTYPWGNTPELQADSSALKKYIGTYTLNQKNQLFITIEGGLLTLSGTLATGVSKQPMLIIDKATFYIKKYALWVEVLHDSGGRSNKLITSRGGQSFEWEKQ